MQAMSHRDREIPLLRMPVTSEVFARKPELPALVLVHGLGSAGNIWKTLHAGLEEHFSIYPVDLPGHGSAPLHDEPLDPRSLAHSCLLYTSDAADE